MRSTYNKPMYLAGLGSGDMDGDKAARGRMVIAGYVWESDVKWWKGMNAVDVRGLLTADIAGLLA